MQALIGFALGAIASSPAADPVVTLSLSAMLAVDCAITGFILSMIEKAR